jgi:hypothetical protein
LSVGHVDAEHPAVCGRGAEQDVEDALSVGLDVAGKAAEHLGHRRAGLLGGVLEEDVVSIGDLDEEVSAAAGLALFLGGALGQDGDAGGVGRDAECLGHRLNPRGFDDRGAHRTGDDEPALAAALPGEFAALLEVHPRGLALLDEILEDWVRDLDAHLRDLQAAQVAAARRFLVLAAGAGAGRGRATGSLGGRRLCRDLTRELVECSELRGKLELELFAVDALGLRDEDPQAQQLLGLGPRGAPRPAPAAQPRR